MTSCCTAGNTAYIYSVTVKHYCTMYGFVESVANLTFGMCEFSNACFAALNKYSFPFTFDNPSASANILSLRSYMSCIVVFSN